MLASELKVVIVTAFITVILLFVFVLPSVRFAVNRRAVVANLRANSQFIYNDKLQTDLAICVIVKDELDLPEWITYHFRMGVSKIYLYDHNSSTPLEAEIETFIKSNIVEYTKLTGKLEPTPIIYAYSDCLRKNRNKHKWIAFIDSDEFLVINRNFTSEYEHKVTISEILNTYYGDKGGVTVNWRVFGSSDHITRPKDGVLKNYHKCFDNFHVKSIVNTKYVSSVSSGNPHFFLYNIPYYAVDTAYNRVNGPFNPTNISQPVPSSLFDILYINHYNVKSESDFHDKIVRGKADFRDGGEVRKMGYFHQIDVLAVNDCEVLEMPEE